MSQKYTIQDMQELAADRSGVCLSSEYINSQTKLEWKCSKGHIWKAVPAKIKFGQWCRICSGYERLNINDMKEIAMNNGGKCLSEVYKNNQSKLLWECAEGHRWLGIPSSIRMGRWCPKCSYKRRGENQKLTIDEMVKLAQSKGGRCLSETYVDAHTPLEWICTNGHVWLAKPNSIKNGHWCASCRLLTEEKCRMIIEQLTGVKFTKNKSIIKPYELDGFNEDLQLAFEYHGVQHYEYIEHFHKSIDEFLKRQKVDMLKEQMCVHNNIRLITIPYTISNNDRELIKFIIEQLEELDITLTNCEVSLGNFYIGIKPLIKLRELASKRGGECITNEYINNKTKIQWRCKDGHEWGAKPNDITSGQWCPQCARNQQLTIDEMREIAKSRNGRCHSKEYLNNRTKLQWECEMGHKWSAIADDVKRGKWCKDCSTKRRAEASKLTIEEMKKLATSRGGQCLSEHYINSQTHLKWICNMGHEWLAKPNNIRSGTWCPKCKNRKSKNPISLKADFAANEQHH